jgi:hypothetical protein
MPFLAGSSHMRYPKFLAGNSYQAIGKDIRADRRRRRRRPRRGRVDRVDRPPPPPPERIGRWADRRTALTRPPSPGARRPLEPEIDAG